MSQTGSAASLRAPQLWSGDPAPTSLTVEQASGQPAGNAPGFYLFLLVNAVLFVRPSEIFPELGNIYEILIVVCLVVSLPAVIDKLVGPSLVQRPTIPCILGILVAVVLSNLMRGEIGEAKDLGKEFAKVVVYYLLFLVNVDSIPRIRQFLTWLVGFITIVTITGVLQYHEYINIPSLVICQQKIRDAYDEVVDTTPRLVSTGIYSDPNDLAMILQVSMLICLYEIEARKGTMLRWIYAGPFVLFGYGLMLTQSRGGFLAFVVSLFALLGLKLGPRRAAYLGVVLVPILLVVFAGRQTDISVTDKRATAQARFQLWTEGLEMFKQSPLWGAGAGTYKDQAGLVAHNSYVHAFAELGFLGAACFVGMFYASLKGLWGLRKLVNLPGLDPEIARLWPYLVVLIVAYAISMFSLSRNYVAPTYTLFAVTAVYIPIVCRATGTHSLQFDGRFILRVVRASVVVLVFHYAITRVMVGLGH